MQKTEMIELHQDGKVSGALTGIYFKIDSGKGYDYLTLDTGFVVYKGIFFEQTDDAGEKVMTFSAIGSDNTCIWGSM